MEKDNNKIIYIIKRLFYIYRKFLEKKKFIYFFKYYTNILHLIYQKKYGITIKQEIIHNRLFNDSKIKQRIINELKIKYSQLEGVKYTFLPIINNNAKIKTPKNNSIYNSCVISPSIKKFYNFNESNNKLVTLNNETILQKQPTKNKTSQNFFSNKYKNNFNTFNSINYTDLNNLNNNNRSHKANISLKKTNLSKSKDTFNSMNYTQKQNMNSSVYNNIIKNKSLKNDTNLNNNSISNYFTKNSNTFLNRNKENSSLKKKKTTPKSNYFISKSSKSKDKGKDLIEIPKGHFLKKHKSISLIINNTISNEVKKETPFTINTNNDKVINTYFLYKDKIPSKKEYFYTFRNGQIPLTSFNTTSNIKSNCDRKKECSNISLTNKTFTKIKNFETANMNKNILNNIYLSNYNKKIYRLNKSKNICSHINSTENSSNAYCITNNSLQNRKSDKSYKIKLLGKNNSSVSNIHNFSKLSETSNKTNQSQRNFYKKKLYQKIPHKKNENIANKKLENYLQNENNLTLQSISDSKMMEMANYYIGEDETLDDYVVKKVMIEKKNKTNKIKMENKK